MPDLSPLRVYNNGSKTIIEMQKTMSQSEAPALLVLRSRDYLKKIQVCHGQLSPSRVSLHRGWGFDKAILVIGSGSSQEKLRLQGVEDEKIKCFIGCRLVIKLCQHALWQFHPKCLRAKMLIWQQMQSPINLSLSTCSKYILYGAKSNRWLWLKSYSNLRKRVMVSMKINAQE